jgi:hypothetical protein
VREETCTAKQPAQQRYFEQLHSQSFNRNHFVDQDINQRSRKRKLPLKQTNSQERTKLDKSSAQNFCGTFASVSIIKWQLFFFYWTARDKMQ